jgi:hypothetical protein
MQKFEAATLRNLAQAEQAKARSDRYFSRPNFDHVTHRWDYTGNDAAKKRRCSHIASIYKMRKANIE